MFEMPRRQAGLPARFWELFDSSNPANISFFCESRAIFSIEQLLVAKMLPKKKLAAAAVQPDGAVLIWHMIDWFSTACCIWGATASGFNF